MRWLRLQRVLTLTHVPQAPVRRGGGRGDFRAVCHVSSSRTARLCLHEQGARSALHHARKSCVFVPLMHMLTVPKSPNKVENAEGLKARMLVSGKQKGCGQCLWANEFEIGI